MAEVVDIVIPDFEGTESVIAAWLKSPGDRIARHEPIAEISTDKVTVEVPAPADGVLEEVIKQANDAVEPGDVIGRVRTGVESGEGNGSGAARGAPVTGATTGREAVTASAAAKGPAVAERLSPAVRRLVREHDVDVSAIAGTGRGGRVTARDVEAFLAPGGASRAASSPTRASSAPAREPRQTVAPKSDTRVPHSPMRKGIAEHMVRSVATAPHVTSVMDADLTRVIAHRQANRAAFEKDGVRLTLTAYFVLAAVDALRSVPEVNSRWHEDAVELLADCNVGIATALETGLIVPVIRKAQTLDLRAVAEKLTDMTARARKGQLNLDEVQNGTFTITNHGGGGSIIATPIINQPQSAILGVGRVEKRVIVREIDGEDALFIRPMVYLTVTIDHRVLDGYTSNTFLSRVVEVLEGWDQ